jgi:hypothetical protein
MATPTGEQIKMANDIIAAKSLLDKGRSFSDVMRKIGIKEEEWKSFYRKQAIIYHPDRRNKDFNAEHNALFDNAFKALGSMNSAFDNRKAQKEEDAKMESLSGIAKAAYDALEESCVELTKVSRELQSSRNIKDHAIVPHLDVYVRELRAAQKDIVANQAPKAVKTRMTELKANIEDMHRDEPPGFKNHSSVKRAFSNFFKRIQIFVTQIYNPEKADQMKKSVNAKNLIVSHRKHIDNTIKTVQKSEPTDNKKSEKKSSKRKGK